MRGPFAGPEHGRADAADAVDASARALIMEAMTPPLPGPDDDRMPREGASFDDRVLLLLAAVALADGILTYPEYELSADVARRIFGERAMHAGIQARFHAALLHPPADPESLALTLAREAAEQKVSADQIEALLSGLDQLGAMHDNMGDMAGILRESIDIAFAEQRLRERRLSLAREKGLARGAAALLESGAGLGVSMGKVAVGGAVSLVQSVADMAGRLWPAGRGLPDPAQSFTPPAAACNAAVARCADALGRAAWTLGEEDLLRELQDFRLTLAEQPFKVVLVGEGKRGKSSLINALLGEELSPVRESVPETATVAEFSFAPRPSYSVRFLDEDHYAHLEEYLAGEEENEFLRSKVRDLRERAVVDRPGGLITLTSKADIPGYLGTEGRYSSLVGRVCLALPVELLAGGMVLVDTPGLNATDAFHDYLAYEESLTADCLLVLLDARRPDSASELRLLRKLAASGRAVAVVGVMTGVDRLNSADSQKDAARRALGILHEACRGAPGLRVLGLTAINARQAMAQRCRPDAHKSDPAAARAMDELFAFLREAMALDVGKEAYRRKLAARSAALADLARKRLGGAFERYRCSLPPAQFLELLERHAESLGEAARALSEQARSVIAAAAHDVDEWRVEQEQALDDWEEKLVLRVMDAARRRADEMGSSFARESAWKEFDAEEAPRIARQSLDEFLSRQQDKLCAWNEKLRLFNEEIRELSALCLKAVEESADELGDICAGGGNLDHFLVQTNNHMRRLAVFLTGAGTGALVAGGLLNLVALGSAAFVVLTNPLVLPGAALMGVAAYALQSVGNVEKRKKAFLARKEKKTRQWAAEVRLMLEAELRAAREDVAAAYRNAVARGFVPALEIVAGEAAHLTLYLKVMDRIREDSDAFERSVNEVLDAMKGPELSND